MQISDTLKPGQIWRQYSDKDYGDIIRFKVTASSARAAHIENCATGKPYAVTNQGELDTFTFDCELMEAESQA